MPRNLELLFADDNETITGISYPETGNTVDLTGLSPNERAYCLILAGHDPQTYDGRWGVHCLIGQVGRLIRTDDGEPESMTLALLSLGVSKEQIEEDRSAYELAQPLNRIYDRAAEKPYNLDGQAALDMAREELGVDLDNLPKEMEKFPAPGSEGS